MPKVSLSTVAYGALIHAAQELKDSGTFDWVSETARARELRSLLAKRQT
jgi:hypothetical protein